MFRDRQSPATESQLVMLVTSAAKASRTAETAFFTKHPPYSEIERSNGQYS